jgi:hypothetical protein
LINGYSMRGIAVELKKQKVPTPGGGKWHRQIHEADRKPICRGRELKTRQSLSALPPALNLRVCGGKSQHGNHLDQSEDTNNQGCPKHGVLHCEDTYYRRLSEETIPGHAGVNVI